MIWWRKPKRQESEAVARVKRQLGLDAEFSKILREQERQLASKRRREFLDEIVEDVPALFILALLPGFAIGWYSDPLVGLLYGLGTAIGYAFDKQEGKRSRKQ
ncbi:hypothetical protein [Thermodesulfitimonas autotrophica]|uniref:hypothetical protein n=1 Tax=Thermodesulfitimonas autotrophica TaxID=1894989 RepID=UPI002FE03C3A